MSGEEATYESVIQGGTRKYSEHGIMWANGKTLKELAGVTDEYTMFDTNDNEIQDGQVYEMSERGIFPVSELP